MTWIHDEAFIQSLYIVAFALFIYGLMGLTGPHTAVRGNLLRSRTTQLRSRMTQLRSRTTQLRAERPVRVAERPVRVAG